MWPSSPPRQPLAGGGKWAALAASIWIQCASGSSYCFGIYSPLLKASQGYDQSTLDSVAFFKDVGANVGVISGILSSSLPSAPWAVLLAGAALNLAGYLPLWLAVSGAFPGRLPVPLMSIFMLLAAQAQTFFNTANVVTAVENFPAHRGTVIGIMKGFLGLSGAILVQIYRTFGNKDASSFLLLLTLLPTLLPLFLMLFVRVHSATGAENKRYLDAFSVVTVVIASYLMLAILGENILALGSLGHKLFFAALVLLLLSPLLIVIRAQQSCFNMEPESSSHEAVRLLLETPDSAAAAGCAAEKSSLGEHDLASSVQVRCADMNILQAMREWNFWLLFIVVACGLGSGLATVNNISQIGASLGYTERETNTLVSLWSIWNFLGRFGLGYISDHFLRSRRYPRPLFIVVTLAVMSVGHTVIASGIPGALYMGSTVIGICYGSIWVLMPSIASEIFGLRHLGTIFNTIAIASPFGSYILSVRVVRYIYDMEATATASADGSLACSGGHCFMLSFFILASVCLAGFGVSLVFFFRTRGFYKQVVFASL